MQMTFTLAGVPLLMALTLTTVGNRYTLQYPAPPLCRRTEIDLGFGKSPKDECHFFDTEVGRGYGGEIVAFPDSAERPDARQLLLAAADGAASATDSDVVDRRAHSVDGYPALDVTLYPRGQGHVAFLRLVMLGKYLITVTADGYGARAIPADASAFIGSLKILPTNAN